jgi:NADPH:quinone reductase
MSGPVPFIPGSEYAGVVVDVGTDVDDLKPGDHVFGGGMNGAFASLVAAKATSLHRIPLHVDLHEASGFWVTYSTAYHTLRSVAGVSEGDWVVILGAAGGVGLASVDVGRLLGARVVAAASSDQKLEVCAARGAVGLINYTTEDLKIRIRDITGDGADVVVDPVGGPYAEQALRSIRWGGRFVCVGFATGEIPRIPLNLVLLKGVVIKAFEARTFGEHAPEASRLGEAELMEHLVEGRLHPHISEVYPLEEAAGAMRSVRERRARGKVVIVP